MMNKIYLTIALILSFLTAQSQKRMVVQAIDVVEGRKKLNLFATAYASESIKLVPSYCVNFLANHKKFSIVDRQNISLISNEKELQKSEEFIDGYIVDQGKSEGADFVLKPLYISGEKMLILKVYDVESGTVKCSKERKMDTNILGIKNLEAITETMLHELLFTCFEIKYSFVRPVEVKKDEVKTFLLSMGTKHKVKKEDRVEVFYYVTENIDNEDVSRKVIIGEGQIEEVQDDNFSVVKIKKGGKEISTLLNEKQKISCIISNIID